MPGAPVVAGVPGSGKVTVQHAVYQNVWFRFSESTWSRIELPAWQDTGVLEVRDGAVTFRGAKYAFEIREFTGVSMTMQGRDFINQWVRVDYRDEGTPRVAYFNDGSCLGWGGVFGGATRLGVAIAHASGLASALRTQVVAGWYADPTGRHESRYWDGTSWTGHVSDAGTVGNDPLDGSGDR